MFKVIRDEATIMNEEGEMSILPLVDLFRVLTVAYLEILFRIIHFTAGLYL